MALQVYLLKANQTVFEGKPTRLLFMNFISAGVNSIMQVWSLGDADSRQFIILLNMITSVTK